ncbi:methylglyoxal synthase [Maricurvus nonylphenolicus]|uniref:methylglyoxal synthase n=1 Tax=Maricurvus nonylphenolicus TaxID=1008307 RepID=UPI0036F3E9F6
MKTKVIDIPAQKTIALVAHDNLKPKLVAWCEQHKAELEKHKLFATGTTGKKVALATGLELTPLISGPLGGDQQIGAKISEGEIDVLIFFWDPLEPMPHDMDVKALLRVAAVWNIPVACNASSADMIITSSLMNGVSQREIPDYDGYLQDR